MTSLREALASAQQLPALTLTTGLPAVLDGTASDLDVARSLLAICAVLLFLLAGATLLAVARLLAGQREGESAMLAARGAARWQLVAATAAEAVPLCVLASALGGVAGLLLARLLASGTGLASGSGLVFGSGPAAGAWLAAGAVAAGATAIMLVPALSTVTPGTARARRGRQSAIAGVTRAGADLALVLLAVLAGWQLRHYSAVAAGANGDYGIDPVVVIAPALALAGGTVAALRLLPAAGKAGDRLAARGRRLTAAMASWQISRQPIRQGGAALLIVLAVATGTLALSQRQSWTRSDHDQAAFAAGADVRVDASQPLSAAQAAGRGRLPGRTAGHAGRDVPAADRRQRGAGGRLRPGRQRGRVARRPVTAGRGRAVRHDRARRAAAGGGAAGAVRRRCELVARLGPSSLGLGPATVSVSVQDADHDVYQLDAGLAARRRPGPHPDRHPGRPGGRSRRRRGRGRARRGHLPAAADGGQPGLHAARPAGPRASHVHRGRILRRAGDGPRPGAALGGWTAAGSSRRAGRRPAGRRHRRAVRPCPPSRPGRLAAARCR